MKPESWQQIEKLYHAALELAPHERHSFVAAACAGDDALRREVESLLACDEQADYFLEKPAKEIVAQKFAHQQFFAEQETTREFLIGAQLNSYHLRSLLGAGGMGEVYRARDTRLERDVAIKVLPDALAQNPDRVRRFEREAHALAALNHPNIAAIYGNEQAGEHRFLVLELIEGQTLDEKLNERPLSVAKALPIFRQIAAALQAAHDKGIVHRDLKPANIKITPEGTVKVLDFGIAKILRPAVAAISAESSTLIGSPTVSDTLTQAGMIVGTVAYMSPEQARGKEQQDHRTDLWAFGCLLFEALSGTQPFSGETLSDTLGAILSEEPDWKLLPTGTPTGIQYLLRRCLEKDPARRPRDAAEIISALETTQTRKTSPVIFLRLSTLRLSRLQWRAPLVMASALLVIVAFSVWQYLHEQQVIAAIPEQKSLAVSVFKNQSGQNDDQPFRAGLAEYLSASLSQLSNLQVIAPSALSGDSPAEPDAQWLAKNFGVNLILNGSVLREGSRVRVVWSLRNVNGVVISGDKVDGNSHDLLRLQDQVAQRVVTALRLPPGTVRQPAQPQQLTDPAAQEHYLQALGYLQREPDLAAIEKALELLEDLSKTDGNDALVHAALGKAYLFKHNLTSESALVEQASRECEQALQLAPALPEVRTTLGLTLTRRGQYPQAIAAFQEALKERPDDPDALQGLAAAYDEAGQTAEAETLLQSAIARRPNYWGNYNELGIVYFNQAQYEKALEQFQLATKYLPDSASLQTNLGNTLYSLGKTDEAMTAFTRSISLHPTVAGLIGLGTALFYREQYADAAQQFEKAIALNRPDADAGLWGNLADAYRWIPGSEAKSAAAYDEAIRLMKSEVSVNPQDAQLFGRLAEWQAKRGLRNDALNNLTRALQLDPQDIYCQASAIVVYHLTDNRTQALQFVKQAVSNGYSVTELERDPELSALQKTPEFQTIIHQQRNKTDKQQR